MRTLTELNTLILGWAAERQILKNSTPFAQAKKTAEEVMELIQADKWYHIALLEESKRLAKLDVVTGEPEDGEDVQFALEDIKDAIGDIYVTLVVGWGCTGRDLPSDLVFDQISDSPWSRANDGSLRYMVCDVLPGLYADAYNWLIVRYHGCILYILGRLSSIAKTYGLTLEECVDSAYEQIKDRKGYLREDGVFVKETT